MYINGRNDLGEYLGRGRSGSVYKCGDSAIKLYHDIIYEIDKVNPCLQINRRKFKLMQMRASRIEHTPLVEDLIYLNGKFHGVSYPYIEGEPLNKIFRKLSIEDRINLSRQIIRNAKELTDNQIYPKDYRLPNIIYDAEGNIRIIDVDDTHTRVTVLPNYLELLFSLSSLASLLTIFLEGRDLDDKKYEIFAKYKEAIKIRRRKILSYQKLSSYVDFKLQPIKTIFIDISDLDNIDLTIINRIVANTKCEIVLVSLNPFEATVFNNIKVPFYDFIVFGKGNPDDVVNAYLNFNNITKHLLFEKGQLTMDNSTLDFTDINKAINYLNEETQKDKPREKQLIIAKNL